jgi:AcrR family transcriptional regulator
VTSVTRTSKPSRRSQRRDEIRGALLTAVEDLLKEERYTDVSVGRLVQAAGVSRSTFYVHFEDKGELLRALTEDAIAELIASARVWWDLPAGATKDDVRAALGRLVDTYVAHRMLLAAVVEAATYDERVRERFGEMLQQAVAGLAAHIRAGQRDGYVRADLDADGVAAWLTWMAERGLFALVGPADASTRARLVDALTEILVNVLYEGRR